MSCKSWEAVDMRPSDSGFEITETTGYQIAVPATPAFPTTEYARRPSCPHYSPHSFSGKGRRGAWQLIPGAGFLIHEGADSNAGDAGGSVGCIEVGEGGWNAFLGEIEALAGGPCTSVGASRKLTVTIEYAP